MKKFIVLAGLFLCGLQASAQLFSGESLLNQPNIDDQRWSWGYFLGLNSYDYDFDYKENSNSKDVILERSIGFNVGLLGNLNLTKNLDLRLEPGVSFNTIRIGATPTSTPDEVTSTYVHIPLLLKFSANRLNNFRPFIMGGISTSVNLSSNEDNPDNNMIKTTTSNYYYELGIGIDLYFYYFKLSPSLRGVFGLNDEYVTTNNENIATVSGMKTRGIFLNFTFQ